MFVRDISRDLYAYLDVSEYRDQTTWFKILRYSDQIGIVEAGRNLANGVNLSFIQSTVPAMFQEKPEECAALLAPFWDQVLHDFDQYLPKMETFRQKHSLMLYDDLGGWGFTDASVKDVGLFERSFFWEDLPEVIVMRDFKTPGFAITKRNPRAGINWRNCQDDSRVTDARRSTIRLLATCGESDFREIIYKSKITKKTLQNK